MLQGKGEQANKNIPDGTTLLRGFHAMAGLWKPNKRPA
jgi:hypothetical protein